MSHSSSSGWSTMNLVIYTSPTALLIFYMAVYFELMFYISFLTVSNEGDMK